MGISMSVSTRIKTKICCILRRLDRFISIVFAQVVIHREESQPLKVSI